MTTALKTMPTALEIVSLYLWGKKQPPAPNELNDDKWIRRADERSSIFIDAESYMKDSGGRFATPDRFKIITAFFDKNIKIKHRDTPYTFAQICKEIYPDKDSKEFLTMPLYQYDLGILHPDYQDRAYVFGSTRIKLANEDKIKIYSESGRNKRNTKY